MKCYLCGSEELEKLYSYIKADPYLKTVNIDRLKRYWLRCNNCGFYQQWHDGLDDFTIEKTYLNYRDYELRGKTVSESFNQILNIPDNESECRKRIDWLTRNLWLEEPVYDIGSGFGIFPYLLRKYVNNIHCIEPEPESAKFIREELGIECKNQFYEPGLFPKSYLVTLVHVLEHVRNPVEFLTKIRLNDLKDDGWIFIEVPDSIEFEYLDQNHDEFNSLHLYFYNIANLDKVLQKAGFTTQIIQRLEYKQRNLSRLLALAKRSEDVR